MKTGLLAQQISQAHRQGQKLLAILIDPDKSNTAELARICHEAEQGGADLLFVGGSLLTDDRLNECLKEIRSLTKLPVLLFPGSVMQISNEADGILFLSLISGRNPELLIGSQVIAAPYLKQSNLEILPTGYMLVDCGKTTTAIYMSGSQALPYDKPEIAACTAMAGEMLGLQYFYLDGGSGAPQPVSPEMIAAVRKSVDKPIIVGGGIRDGASAAALCEAGADVIVIGNATESNPQIISEIAQSIHVLR